MRFQRMSSLVAPVAMAVALTASCSVGRPPGRNGIVVTSPAFRSGEDVPAQNTCGGANTSPALAWKPIPKSAKSITVTCDDPDAPSGDWVHWVLYNLPPSVAGLPGAMPTTANLNDGAVQGTNDFHTIGYSGPCPPPGAPHHYHFRVDALNVRLSLPPGATKAALDAAMQGHILAQGELVGLYGR
jgi:Raf kinase inhibitor-like YbhB/YbcL family protein